MGGGRSAEIAVELASHFDRCGDQSRTLKYLEMAGASAMEKRAFREADRHYHDALTILQTLPESSERDSAELRLQVACGHAMQATRGWSAVETGAAYSRARVLAERAQGANPIQVLGGLWSATNLRGELRAALALADQMLIIANGLGTPAALFSAHTAQGYTRYLLGDLVAANEHLVQAIELRRSQPELNFREGGDPLTFAAQNAWHLGYPTLALHYMDEIVSRARGSNNAFAVGFSCWFRANVHAFRGDFIRARADNDEALRLGAASGFALLSAIGEVLDAWIHARMGETEEAIERIQKGLSQLDSLNFHLTRAKYLGFLCEAQLLAGAFDAALATVEQALQVNPDELTYRPETLRLRAELRLCKKQEGAEQDLYEAIKLARRMSAKSPELRATTSLARVLRDMGRRDEARTMLAEIYNWFTEGFDTRDLREAKELLEDLSGVAPRASRR